MRTITIVNQSSVVGDTEFRAAVAACQRQVSEHFGPAWGGLSATLVAQSAPPGAGQLVSGECIYVLDDSDQQGALGYHELSPAGAPIGFVFAGTSKSAGDPWQTTLSHELLEQLADPFIDSCAEVDLPWHFGRTTPAIVSYEVCDPVENDTYLIDGVPVSNFVLPSWFQSPKTPTAKPPFDYLSKLSAPLSLSPGGYISYSTNLRAWGQLSARKVPKPDKYVRHGKKKRVHWPDLLRLVGMALLALPLLCCGCGEPKAAVEVQGGQRHDVHVSHDPQRTDVWIHRDRRKHPNPPPK